MRRQIAIICSATIFVGAVVVLFRLRTQPQPVVKSIFVSSAASVTLAAVPTISNSVGLSMQPATPRNSNGTPKPVVPTVPKEQQMRQGLAELNDEEVVLYGCVKDQFDSPVAGAVVEGSIQVNNGTRTGTDRVSLTTDANGTFTISGYKGKALGLNIVKDGYVMATANTRFVYSLLWPASERHVPDPHNPVVFRMWKRQGAEPLVGFDQNYKVSVTGSPVIIDLIAGRVVPNGGDVLITVDRPAGTVSQRFMQDWGFKIEAVDGGVIEIPFADARVTFQAPGDGYLQNVEVLSAKTNHWSDLEQQMLFVKSRNGQVYSKVFLSFRINEKPEEPVLLNLTGVANTNGSRNWEATAPQSQ